MKVHHPLHSIGFDALTENEKNKAETTGEYSLCAILYIKNYNNSRFYEIKKRVEDDCVINKSGYPRTITAVQSLLLSSEPNYNSSREYQYQRVINQLIFKQCEKN